MIIIKIGGGEKINMEAVVKDLKQLKDKYIIVHGANHERDSLLKELGKEKKVLKSLKGYSSVFSDKDAIYSIMMAYSGLKNKRIVELCQLNGINAVGLSGIDGKLVQSIRNKGIKIKEGGKIKIVRDFSGKPQKINTELLTLLLENNYFPILCIPTVDEEGYAINSENDDIVALLKHAMQADTVIQLIEAPGLLEDKNDNSSLIRRLTSNELEKVEEKVEGRMKRKILALRSLFEAGPCKVIITDGRVEHPIQNALNGYGTVIE